MKSMMLETVTYGTWLRLVIAECLINTFNKFQLLDVLLNGHNEKGFSICLQNRSVWVRLPLCLSAKFGDIDPFTVLRQS